MLQEIAGLSAVDLTPSSLTTVVAGRVFTLPSPYFVSPCIQNFEVFNFITRGSPKWLRSIMSIPLIVIFV